MINGIDHLVILVRNLEQAIKTYQGLGFQVSRGGEHPGGTHNALVGFANGTYLELIAFQEPDKPHEHRWYGFLRPGGGLVDFALRVDSVEDELRRIQGRGIDYQGPKPGARRRPDGQEIAWRMGWPPSNRTGELPFVIDDITPRDLRVPSGAATEHPNGVTGVQSLVIAVRDLDEAVSDFSAILGASPGASVRDEVLQAETASFPAGEQQIVLAYPTSPSSPIAQRIQRLGDGPYQAMLAATGSDAAATLSPEDAEGARFVIAPVPRG